jgi:hypothetical protein
LNEPLELPSLEEIEQMERRRLQAIESLHICNHSVKCQRCGIAVPVVGKLTRTGNDRISVLQKRIRWLENYHYPSHGNNNLQGLEVKLDFVDFSVNLSANKDLQKIKKI